MKQYSRKFYSDAGKRGVAKRWPKRYETLVELSKIFGKQNQTEFMKWPSKYLEKLLNYARKIKK